MYQRTIGISYLDPMLTSLLTKGNLAEDGWSIPPRCPVTLNQSRKVKNFRQICQTIQNLCARPPAHAEMHSHHFKSKYRN